VQRIFLSGQGRILGGGYLGVDDLLGGLLYPRDDGRRARLDGVGERLEDAVGLDGPVLIDPGADKPPPEAPSSILGSRKASAAPLRHVRPKPRGVFEDLLGFFHQRTRH
jgi:hypothetical protein